MFVDYCTGLLASKSWLLVIPVLAVAIVTIFAGNASGKNESKSVDKIIFPVIGIVVLIGVIWEVIHPTVESSSLTIINCIIAIIMAVLFAISFIPLKNDRSIGQLFGYYLCGYFGIKGIAIIAGYKDTLPIWISMIIGVVAAILCISFVNAIINIVVTVIGGAGMCLVWVTLFFQNLTQTDVANQTMIIHGFGVAVKSVYIGLIVVGFIIQIITYMVTKR